MRGDASEDRASDFPENSARRALLARRYIMLMQVGQMAEILPVLSVNGA
jgi:hypothetical protein